MTIRLDAMRIGAMFIDCLFTDEEAGNNTEEEIKAMAILVEWMTSTFGFATARIDKHRKEITAMLGELNDDFRHDGGGGSSIAVACHDRHGKLWGDHRSVMELFVLGMAIGRVQFCAPRSMWDTLPSGLPYVKVLVEDNGIEEATPADATSTGDYVQELHKAGAAVVYAYDNGSSSSLSELWGTIENLRKVLADPPELVMHPLGFPTGTVKKKPDVG